MSTRVWAVLATVATVVALAGCGMLDEPYREVHREGGITSEQAEQMVEAVPGVTEAEFTAAAWDDRSRFSEVEGMDLVLEVTFDPDYHLSDLDTALDQLVAVAWSANVHSPKGYVIIVFDGGVSPNTTWAPVAQRLYGNGEDLFAVNPVQMSYYTDTSFDFSGSSGVRIRANLDDRYGRWPGNPPTTLELGLVEGPPETVILPAFVDAEVHGLDTDSGCWTASVTMHERYDGTARAEIMVDGTLFATETLSGSWHEDPDDPDDDDPATSRPPQHVELCGDHAPPAHAHVSVVFTPEGDPDRFDLTPLVVDAS
ncbi:MAG: hypothetical protein FWF02_09690 [Micrococcales bacterium]|nr:hypothetical protein [Micrococcales bacterium]MCL2667960.1 hypothetical protein [Micrococcales bacterium]